MTRLGVLSVVEEVEEDEEEEEEDFFVGREEMIFPDGQVLLVCRNV